MISSPRILLGVLGEKHALSETDVKNRMWTGHRLATAGETPRLKATQRVLIPRDWDESFQMILFELLDSARPMFLITEPADVLVPQVHREPSLSKPVWIKFLSLVTKSPIWKCTSSFPNPVVLLQGPPFYLADLEDLGWFSFLAASTNILFCETSLLLPLLPYWH